MSLLNAAIESGSANENGHHQKPLLLPLARCSMSLNLRQAT
jgi:hypothetical protein